MLPSSAADQATGTSAKATPLLSVTLTVTGSERAELTCPSSPSVTRVTRVFAATGSASAVTIVGFATPSAITDRVCRPGDPPRVQLARATPCASDESACGSARPSFSSRTKRTGTPGTGRPLRETTCTDTGCDTRLPAGARCPSPESSVRDEGTGYTSTGSWFDIVSTLAVNTVRPGATPLALPV